MQYFNPVNIINFAGARRHIPLVCEDKSVLIICTRSALDRFGNDETLSELFSMPTCILEHDFSSNPAMEDIAAISDKYRDQTLDLVLGLGGGSAMDVAKIASVCIPAAKRDIGLSQLLSDSTLFDKFEALECIQVPTTAGTGSEVTPFATVWDYETQKKKSLSHTKMFSDTCIIDSDFLIDIPLEIAVSTGLDALNQAFESIWNKNANEISLLYAIKAAEIGLRELPKLEDLPKDTNLRQKLMTASLLSGIAISQTRTAICHSISYPLTLRFGVPHGLACAFSMIPVIDFNAELITKSLSRINGFTDVDQVKERILCIFEGYEFKEKIKKYIPTRTDVYNLCDEMFTTGRFDNNIKQCERADLEKIIAQACEGAFGE